MLSRTILWSVALCVCWPAAGIRAAPADLAPRVRALVLQLNDPDLSTRQAAEQALTKLGGEVLPFLPALTPQTPAEVQERLVRIRSTLERASVAATLQPTRVTLQGDMTVPEALDRIQQQTGNRLNGYQGRPGSLKLNLTDMLFWAALDEVLDQADLDINPFAGQAQTLVLVSRPPHEQSRKSQAMYSGGFRFEVVRIEARRDLRAPETSTLRITLGISWEPRLAPISLRQPIDALQVVDASERNLVPPGRSGVLNASVEGGLSSVEIALPLQLPNRDVPRIARLSGIAEALIPGGLETFSFSDLSRATEQHQASVHVTLERWRKNLDVYEARIRVRYDNPGTALDSHRGWIYRNKAYLLGADNKRVDDVGMQLLHQGPGELGLAYLFDLEGSGDGYRFVYETPAAIERIPVQYEFLNIALP